MGEGRGGESDRAKSVDDNWTPPLQRASVCLPPVAREKGARKRDAACDGRRGKWERRRRRACGIGGEEKKGGELRSSEPANPK